jgi:glycosyltransferase involved in cell wall biosynthesis
MTVRVAYLFEYPTVSGGERSLLSFLDHLDRDQYRPLILAPLGGILEKEIESRNLDHVPFSLSGVGRRRPFDEVVEELGPLLRKHEVDLLHSNSMSCGEYSGLVEARSGVLAVGHIRDIQKLKNSRRRRLAGNRQLIAVSEGVRQHLLGQGFDPDHVTTIWNGIGADFGHGAKLTRPLFPGWRLGMKVVANIGQICLRKAQNLCLEAMAPLLLDDPDLHLLFVGERFSQKDESQRFEDDLHRFVEMLELSLQVHFSGYREDIPALIQHVTVLAHSAHQEPLGRVLLESQIQGVPVVGMKVGGNAEVVADGVTGILVEKGDVNAFRDGVKNTLESADLRRKFGGEARKRALDRFCPVVSAAKVMALYQQICGRNLS